MTDPNDVRARMDELMYAIQFDRDLNDSTRLEFIARSIRDQRNFHHPASEYSDAIAAVLYDGHLPVGLLPTSHGDADLLDWLHRLGEQISVNSQSGPRPGL